MLTQLKEIAQGPNGSPGDNAGASEQFERCDCMLIWVFISRLKIESRFSLLTTAITSRTHISPAVAVELGVVASPTSNQRVRVIAPRWQASFSGMKALASRRCMMRIRPPPHLRVSSNALKKRNPHTHTLTTHTMLTQEDIDLHGITHLPYGPWCPEFVKGFARERPHPHREVERLKSLLSYNYLYVMANGIFARDGITDEESQGAVRVLVAHSSATKALFVLEVPRKRRIARAEPCCE